MQDAAVRTAQLLDERAVLLGVVATGSASKRGGSVEMVNGWRARGMGDELLIDPSGAG